MPFRCRDKDWQRRFSVKAGTIMEGPKVGYQDWIIAAYLVETSLKSVSGMKMHRELRIVQKSAWFLAHRLRAAFETEGSSFSGPVEADEAYFGGKRKNLSNSKRTELKVEGAGTVTEAKVAVVGIKARDTNKVTAKVI